MPFRTLAATVALGALGLLAGCTPLTQIEEMTAQNDIAARPLSHVLLIGMTPDDNARRHYEKQCAGMLDNHVEVTRSITLFPTYAKVGRADVLAWLGQHPEVDAVLVSQVAGLAFTETQMEAITTDERYGLTLYQAEMSYNYQPDPSRQLPEVRTALSQTTLYVRPENVMASTVLARTPLSDGAKKGARSHCKALRDALHEAGWLE